MLKNNYLAVLSFQLKLEIVCKKDCDVLIQNELYQKQMEKSIEIIKSLDPDVVIFPEMAFSNNYDNAIRELSKDKLIVYGSTYIGNINKTKVYQDGKSYEIIKRFSCGSEPMIRFLEKIDVNTFITKYLNEHEFYIKEQKMYVLNCLEYYQTAYMIARNYEFSKDLFGFLVPCSNSNPNVFIEESKAIHNHNENIYSFVCNRVKNDGKSGYGVSYIYGPIQYHEKDWLTEEGILSDKHNSSILKHDSSSMTYSYGIYAIPSQISRFGRSDFYINTPKNVTIKNII